MCSHRQREVLPLRRRGKDEGGRAMGVGASHTWSFLQSLKLPHHSSAQSGLAGKAFPIGLSEFKMRNVIIG
jgi:hypothetical protein